VKRGVKSRARRKHWRVERGVKRGVKSGVRRQQWRMERGVERGVKSEEWSMKSSRVKIGAVSARSANTNPTHVNSVDISRASRWNILGSSGNI
jgi:hypothetical protein